MARLGSREPSGEFPYHNPTRQRGSAANQAGNGKNYLQANRDFSQTVHKSYLELPPRFGEAGEFKAKLLGIAPSLTRRVVIVANW